MLDRAISTKFLTQRVSLRSSFPNFQKKFFSPKMAAILNFRNFRKNYKTQKCLYLKNRARWSNFDKIFDPQDISAEYFSQFSKNFCLAKNGGHFEFSKFLTRRVSLQSSYPNFEKIFVSPKMAAILNFRIFRKNCKT